VLVRQYAARQSESAFAEPGGATRRTGVFSRVAGGFAIRNWPRRLTQVVFVILARKARAGLKNDSAKLALPCRLASPPTTPANRNSAASTTNRRLSWDSTLQEAGSETVWRQMSPPAGGRECCGLARPERDALVLRYFEASV